MSKWPKKLPELTPEQQGIRDDFMQYWLETIAQKFSFIDRFSGEYLAKNCKPGGRILELGPGLGNQIPYEDLSRAEYHAVEIRPNIANLLKQKYPQIHVKIGDCQKKLHYPDGYFDRVQAIHVLEHLPNLPTALEEVTRVLKPDGDFCVVIPCERGTLYTIGREFSGKKIFKKRYGMSYAPYIQSEHINTANEALKELAMRFETVRRQYYPFLIPSIHLNLFIGMVLKPKKPH